MLSEVGFSWTPNSRLWADRFEDLVEYIEKHGDTLVPKRYPDNPTLAHWVKNQRQQYKKYCEGTQPCSLDEEKIRILNEVGFSWGRDWSISRVPANIVSRSRKKLTP
jgi:hypothetical protein